MSTVMRPKGPLPPQVYWTRRLLLLGVLALVLALLWWMLPGFGDSGQASANPGAGGDVTSQGGDPGGATTTQGADATRQSSSPPAAGGQSHQPKATGSPQHHGTTPHHSPPVHHAPPAQVTPTGKCDPATLTMTVAVDSAPVGHGTSVGLRLSTPDGSTCSLAITPSLLESRITSGPATIWQSRSCPDAIPARNVVVGPHPRIVYSFDWDGQFNPDSCSASNQIAQPGGYWAEVALVGGEPHKSYFEVTSPSTPVHKS